MFTGGIGENVKIVRSQVMEGLEYLGVDFDKEKSDNAPRGQIVELQKASSKVKVLVLPTNEELVIARETLALI